MYSGRLCRNKCCSSSRPTEVPMSCEVMGLRSEKRYRLRRGAGVSLWAQSGGDNVFSSCVSPGTDPLFLLQPQRLKQEKPTLGSALIHGETFIWSANITAKQREDSVSCFFLGFGVLFIIQAILNISLRLTLYSSKESTQSNSNATDFCNQNQVKEEENDCERKKPGEYNRCQDRINALTRDKNLLKNRNTELTNMIKNVEEERDRLKSELKELSSCSSSQQCPAGWRLINSRCYFVSTEDKTWKDSRTYCQSKDADLVVINNKEEQRSLYRLNGSVLAYWIGLYDPTGSTGSTGWKWVDGSALTKSFWTSGQPDRNPMKVENCVQMYHFYPRAGQLA